MGVFGGPAGWTVSAGQAAADALLGTGGDNTGAVENSDSVREARNRTVTGAANYAYASALDTAHNLGVGDVTESDVREQWVATGEVRDVIDTAVEYEGDWGDSRDSVDLVGPAAWGTDSSLVTVATDLAVNRNDNTPGGNDPDPDVQRTRWLIYAALGGLALIVLSPVLRLLASTVDAVGGD